MNKQETWAPVLAFLAEQGVALPDKVQIQVAGHTIEVEVPVELKSNSAPSS